MDKLCELGPILKPFIVCFWTFESGPGSAGVRQIIPDGKTGLIIRYSEGGSGPRVFFSGPSAASSEYEMESNQKFFGINFHSAGASEFLKMPMSDLTERTIDLEAWDKLWAIELLERLAQASTRLEKSKVARCLLERRLIASRPDLLTTSLINEIWKNRGNTGVKNLVQISGLSERQVERKFLEKVGLSPRELSCIYRFRHTVAKIRSQPHKSLTEIAIESGYFDQSHFIREFRKMMGVNPKTYLKGPEALNDWAGLDL